MCVGQAKKRFAGGAQLGPRSAVERWVKPSSSVWVGLSLCLLLSACGASQGRRTTPGREVIEVEELRITAARGEQGYRFDVYDAADLFTRATELLNQQKCREAVELYDRLAQQFAESRYASASLYNAGLCLQALGDFANSASRYGALRQRYPESEDKQDASFQLAEVLVQLERWDDTLAVTDELLAKQALSSDERLEGMARRAQALLGLQRFDEVERYARSALSFYRTRTPEDPIKDDFFAAACNYVLADGFRQRAQNMPFPEGLEPQKQVLHRRAELLLEAQREYFNTISLNNLDNYHWAAASGYRIGAMYDEFWHAIMKAPVPANLPPEGHPIYHDELAKLIKPLIRHAIRYWELTEMFIERTGIQTPWAEKIRTDLVRVRGLLLEQPAGSGGLREQQPAKPGAGPAPTPDEKPATTGAGARPKRMGARGPAAQ